MGQEELGGRHAGPRISVGSVDRIGVGCKGGYFAEVGTMEKKGGRARRRLLGLVVVAGLVVLLVAGVAFAASPQDIYNHYVATDNLNGYSTADLNAVLTDPTLAQYANQDELNKLKDLIRTSEVETQSVFPFTGFQMLLIVGAGVVLVGGGVLLRRGQRKSS
jgi:multisubunit Na+/H+ antiporter MnhB subunit